MSEQYVDLNRPPLRAEPLRQALLLPVGPWRELIVLDEVDSTNRVAVERARAGVAEGLVVVAELQTGGRGRLDRGWVSAARAGLTLSVLLRPGPDVPPARWGWLPLLAGVALADAVNRLAVVDATLKWPNDLLVGDRKVAGVLTEVVEGVVPAAVIGVGLNVSNQPDELPGPAATSLALEQAMVTDRDPLLRAILRGLAERYAEWRDAAGEPTQLLPAYRAACGTLGQQVRVELPGGAVVEGMATDVDGDGRLVVDADAGPVPLAAGDVVHLRPAAR